MSNQNQNNRQSGTVKWFNPEKGYGFIAPANGSDVFVHITALQNAGLHTLNDGQAVTFVVTPGKNGKMSAEELQLA